MSDVKLPHLSHCLNFCELLGTFLLDSSFSFPPIPSGPYPPLYEFVSRHWKKPHHHQAPVGGEYLDGQVAIIDHSTGLQRTFRDYAVTTQCLGTALHDIIMKDEFDETNSTVAFFCPNHVDYRPTVLAITLMGAKVRI